MSEKRRIFIVYKSNTLIMNEKYTVYLTCPAFPGKVRKSIVESINLMEAKKLALSLYPGYVLL